MGMAHFPEPFTVHFIRRRESAETRLVAVAENVLSLHTNNEAKNDFQRKKNTFPEVSFLIKIINN